MKHLELFETWRSGEYPEGIPGVHTGKRVTLTPMPRLIHRIKQEGRIPLIQEGETFQAVVDGDFVVISSPGPAPEPEKTYWVRLRLYEYPKGRVGVDFKGASNESVGSSTFFDWFKPGFSDYSDYLKIIAIEE